MKRILLIGAIAVMLIGGRPFAIKVAIPFIVKSNIPIPQEVCKIIVETVNNNPDEFDFTAEMMDIFGNKISTD